MNYKIRKKYDIPPENLCFTAKCFISTGLPVKRPKGNEFKRQNNLVTTNLIAPNEIGLPYGKSSRLALISMVTYVYRNQNQVMNIGAGNLNHFKSFGLGNATSGKIAAQKKDQLNRLLNCAFYVAIDKGKGAVEEKRFFIAKESTKIDVNKIQQIEFSDEFYKYASNKKNIVPISNEHFAEMSAIQMDLYFILSYWVVYLKNKCIKETVVTYEHLEKQLGLSFSERRYFIRSVKNNVSYIKAWLDVKIDFVEQGIQIEPR